MGKHSRLVKALSPFVLILSNADFLWVAEVAKTASVSGRVCVCVCVSECMRIAYVCMYVCLDCLSTREVKPGWHLLHCVCC